MDCDRLVDNSLGGYIDSPVKISVHGGSAGAAGENTLRLAIGLGDKAAGRAGTGSVPGIHLDNRDTCYFCFVLDKAVQLAETPTAESLSVGPAKPCPGAYALQVFQGDSTLRVFGHSNDFFADAMVKHLYENEIFFADFFR
jgi:hypothetical protein